MNKNHNHTIFLTFLLRLSRLISRSSHPSASSHVELIKGRLRKIINFLSLQMLSLVIWAGRVEQIKLGYLYISGLTDCRADHSQTMSLSFCEKLLKWGYSEGNGPSSWSKWFAIAENGRRQSPINIDTTSSKVSLPSWLSSHVFCEIIIPQTVLITISMFLEFCLFTG